MLAIIHMIAFALIADIGLVGHLVGVWFAAVEMDLQILTMHAVYLKH